jgi:hypothetical protein
VFAQKCASAFSKLDGMVNMLSDSLDDTYDSISNACSNGIKGPPSVNAEDVVKKQLDSNEPITAAIGAAMQDAVDCGCKPGTCIWCVPTTSHNSTLTYDLGAGPDSRGTLTGIPKNMTQLMTLMSGLMKIKGKV